jgi:hypothetical protein
VYLSSEKPNQKNNEKLMVNFLLPAKLAEKFGVTSDGKFL